jgi:hypothetical protein
MKKTFYILLLLFPLLVISQTPKESIQKRVTSVVDSSHTENLVLKQSFVVNVAIDSVWNAYTTKKRLGKLGNFYSRY